MSDDSRELTDSTASVVRRWFRMGAAALALGGVLYVIASFLVAGVITPPSETRVITVASAVNANSAEWRVGMVLSFLAEAALTLGWFALYVHLARTHVESGGHSSVSSLRSSSARSTRRCWAW